jgi:hypothetical protein
MKRLRNPYGVTVSVDDDLASVLLTQHYTDVEAAKTPAKKSATTSDRPRKAASTRKPTSE